MIAFWDVGWRSLLRGVGVRSLFGDLGGRSLLRGVRRCDSEALLQAVRFWEMWRKCDRFLGMSIAFWGCVGRSLLGCGRAIAFWGCVGRSLLGCERCDRFLGCEGRSLFWVVGGAIALIMRILEVRSLFGMWECDRSLLNNFNEFNIIPQPFINKNLNIYILLLSYFINEIINIYLKINWITKSCIRVIKFALF